MATTPDATADGIWIINSDGQTVYASQRMAAILGTSVHEMIGCPSFNYVFPDDLAAAQRLFDNKRAGNADPFHFRLRRKDGTAIAVHAQGTPMHNPEGRFNGI